ncbi:methyl-accepting chemotaxis protein [Methylobacterium sp. B4]|uniref:methyl-accepting chemotaxis protein n=1 Tax=Methylobacterium sp. B4 TaxID=1938755 RepID=UPI000D75D562|nr:methyl-accepting chemotaxis protein [Methylobacterium sp. B4]PXW61363.1 methyl-accepting chemotaxis protein [Methylobacterium sp. B4]
MRASIKVALTGLFGVMAILSVGQGVSGLTSNAAVETKVSDITTNWMPSLDLVRQMQATFSDVRTARLGFLLSESDAERVAARRQIDAVIARMQDQMRRYEPLVSSAEERALLTAFREKWTANTGLFDRVANLVEQGRAPEARQLFQTEVRDNFTSAGAILNQDAELNRKGALEAAAAAEAASAWARGVTWLALVLVGLAAIGALAFSFFRIARPLQAMTAAMNTLATGQTGIVVPGTGRRDELGAMAAAVQVFKDNLIRTRALEDETAQARASAEEQRKAGMRQMADRFEAAVGGIVGSVSASATQLQATAQQMTSTAGETASQSTAVAAAAEEAASNVNTVAAAAEELGVSVSEISRQVAGSAGLAQAAVGEADQTAHLVEELSQAVVTIGDVVGLISTIAGQTNLLALNATIEAARAGEAGRGFAVVASEVKELASQTARATEEIGRHIGRIQGVTGQAVSAIGSITLRIREINAVAASIAAAVEEQGAATQEIVRNVSQAATGTGEVTQNMTGLAQASEDTGAAATQVLASASELSRQSEHLSAEVQRFLDTVRAA